METVRLLFSGFHSYFRDKRVIQTKFVQEKSCYGVVDCFYKSMSDTCTKVLETDRIDSIEFVQKVPTGVPAAPFLMIIALASFIFLAQTGLNKIFRK